MPITYIRSPSRLHTEGVHIGGHTFAPGEIEGIFTPSKLCCGRYGVDTRRRLGSKYLNLACKGDARTSTKQACGRYFKLSALCFLFKANQDKITGVHASRGLLSRWNEVKDGLWRNNCLCVGSGQLNIYFG